MQESTLNNGGKTLFIYNVDKNNEVLKMDYKPIEQFIKKMDKLGGRKSFDNAMILIDGYNEVTDELHEIPEVRNYIYGLFQRFPHVLYYINFNLEGHHYMLACLSDTATVEPEGQRKTLDELYRQYGMGNVPKYQMLLVTPNKMIQKICVATIAHGVSVKRAELGMKKANKIQKMFKIK